MSTASAVSTATPECPYAALAVAIVARAVHDATGDVSPAHAIPPSQLMAEARQWLADEANVSDLLALAGYDDEPVLRRIRALLARQETVSVPVTTQLQLF